ncbi:class I SAM-dependent methyltransferase [bacterium]|nr:class I SAM-dependent methyltransferase [bacterium]MCB2179340.1 class I SAM-dependent methyltransferase [bacterium]
MSIKWIDCSKLSFNNLLLLERVQLSWFPGWLPQAELAVALRANPTVEWYFRHKCPELNPWLDGLMAEKPPLGADAETIRQAEVKVMESMMDLLTYAVAPQNYDAQPFLEWDSQELSEMTDYRGKTVLDIGSGTGRLAFVVAPIAETVFAVEPVENLRRYIREKAKKLGFSNVYAVDGLIEEIPFPDGFADVVVGGHVFGDYLEAEYAGLMRVLKPGGMAILCPGNNDVDNEVHAFLVAHGFEWSRFEEPEDGIKRKYWKTKE